MESEMNGEQLLEKALLRVESESIRAWARSKPNHSLWVRIADAWVQSGRTDISWFAGYIVAVALGLL